ncbi:helix-turn-helix domain-containing protein [Rhodospira trueperi]|nr:helix-turn-helix transcriptional regulator [Rhodospira trueperi]
MERDIGEKIRRFREAAGLSREEMAARMGLNPLQMRKLEDGTNIIPVVYLSRAAGILGVSVEAFYGEYDPERDGSAPGQTVPTPLEHPESRALIEAYYEAPEPVRKSFSALLQSFARR